jgi:ABC-type bacteriocin/lantibiotic exporter with double-glycine peptidase domain
VRRIQQRRTIDCGIACVAMLANKSYPVARDAIFQGKKVTRTSAAQLRKALCDFGITLASRSVYVRTRSIESLNSIQGDALIKTNVISCGNWHWMVWDGGRKKHIDPLRKPYKRPGLSRGMLKREERRCSP